MKHIIAIAIIQLAAAHAVMAHTGHTGGIHATADKAVSPEFDIVHAKISVSGNIATFHMAVSGRAGANKPVATGKLAGSEIFSYVWPTTLDSGAVGFDKGAGILALAVTSHADFDDTPLFDENADNNPNNDGDVWHSHWVVLQPNDRCGKGALAVVDIPEGTQPNVPATWPGLPILLDSPGWSPLFNDDIVEVKVPFSKAVNIADMKYDGVTAGLRVNQSIHAPLLCVVDVMDIASNNLSLPGKVDTRQK